MLLSTLPWNTVQYSSLVPRIKFLKEWHFANKPIVVLINQQGNAENKNALQLIRGRGRMAFPFTRLVQTPYVSPRSPPGPDQIQKYILFYGGEDTTWIEQFSNHASVVVEHPGIQEAQISIELSHVEKSNDWKPNNSLWKKFKKLFRSSNNESKWVMLTERSTGRVIDHGVTILNVLENFEEWRVNMYERSFEDCFKDYHVKLLQTRLPTWTSWNA